MKYYTDGRGRLYRVADTAALDEPAEVYNTCIKGGPKWLFSRVWTCGDVLGRMFLASEEEVFMRLI